jgi:SAM-dependent methyltransferase
MSTSAPTGAAPLADFALRFPAPDGIWTPRWAELRHKLLAEAFGNRSVQRVFAEATELPAGYGIAMDERVIEWPWVLANGAGGNTLDAGSALNHADVLGAFAPRLSDLHIVTLEPEEQAFVSARISYVFADLRDLPYRDGLFDTVVSVSTLEHVGMKNDRYGVEDENAEVPDEELAKALLELKRVAKPGGRLLITVPYGRPDDFGWSRIFSREMVERMVEVVDPADAAITVYKYGAGGWQVSDLDAASDAVYREHTIEPEPADLAANARAVACLRLVV